MGPAADPNSPVARASPPMPRQGATFKGLNANQQGRKGSIRPLTYRGRLNSGQTGPCSEYPYLSYG